MTIIDIETVSGLCCLSDIIFITLQEYCSLTAFSNNVNTLIGCLLKSNVSYKRGGGGIQEGWATKIIFDCSKQGQGKGGALRQGGGKKLWYNIVYHTQCFLCRYLLYQKKGVI